MPHRSVHCDSQPRSSSRCTLDEALPAAQHLQSRLCFSARPNVERPNFRPICHANRRCTRTDTHVFLQVNVAAKAAGVCSREGGKPCRQLEAAAGNIHSGMPIGVARRKATQFSLNVSVAAKAAGYGADKGRDPRLLQAVAWTEILVATAPTDAPPGPTRPSRSPPRDPALPRASPALPRRRDDTARSAAHLEDESGHGPGPQEQRPGPACRSPWRGRRGAWPRPTRRVH